MKRLILVLMFIGCCVVHAQQYPPYLMYDASGNPYPSGSGTALPYNPPPFTCYTNVTGQPLPCNFGGSGPSFSYPAGTGIVTVTGGAAWGTTLAAPAGTIVGTTDTQTLTNKTVDGVTPTVFGYVDPASSIQTQLNGKQASGTYVTAVSVATANGISGSSSGGATPALTLALGAITPTSIGSATTGTTQSPLTNNTTLSTTAYTDAAVTAALAGVNPAVAVLAASTAPVTGTYVQVGGGIGDTFTVTATGVFSLDGIAINTIGQRVLLKNQSTASQNGVYTATVPGSLAVSPVFTRALDYDTVSDVNNTGTIPVQSGTVNTTTSWLLTSQVTSIGSAGSSLTYALFSYAPTSLLLAANNLSDVASAATALINLGGAPLASPVFTGTPSLSGLPAGCVQLPCVLGKVNTTTSSTTGVGVTTILTPTYAGVYQMCAYLRMTVVGSAGTYEAALGYTDATVAHTSVAVTGAVSTTSLTSNVNLSPPTNCLTFNADANGAINYSIAASGVTGTPTLEYSVTLNRLQ